MKKSIRLGSFFVVLTLILTMGMTTVTANAAVKPTKITVSCAVKTIDIGSTTTVKVKKVTPSKAGKSVKYASSNKAVATVNSKGVVTGKKAGTAKITVTSKLNKKVKATVKITVKNLKATGINLNSTKLNLYDGYSTKLTATVSGAKGLNKKGVKWASSNTAVARVSSDGTVTAICAGTPGTHGESTPPETAVITATIDGKTAKCPVTVSNGDYNKIGYKKINRAILSEMSQYTIVDVRANVFEYSGMNCGAADHRLFKSVCAPLSDEKGNALSEKQCFENLKNAGVSNKTGQKYVLVCYFGGTWADYGASLLRRMGISNDDIYVLFDENEELGGIWLFDNYSFDYDEAIENYNYMVCTATSKGGKTYNGVKPVQIHEDQGTDAFGTLLDVREADDYEIAHINGAVSVPVPGADATTAAAKDGIRKIVKNNEKNATYTVICYSGNAYADAATELLRSNGVPAENIVRIIGGNNAYAAEYPGDMISFNKDYSYVTAKNLNSGKSGYVVLDVRKAEDYAALHIKGAVSAAFTAGSAEDEAGIANVKAAVEANGKDVKYAVICYSGNAFAKAATARLIEEGVPAENISTLYKGFNNYKAVYPDDCEASPAQ